MTALDIITQALKELGVLAAGVGEVASAAEASDGLDKLNRLLDQWSARRCYVYARQFSVFNLQASKQSYTIGPAASGADWVVNQRPVRIEDHANLVLNTLDPVVRTPIRVLDESWWNDLRARDVGSSIPTGLWYQAAWPLGTVNFWPVPQTACQVELELWVLLSQMALNDAFTMPPAWWDAVVYSLAESMAPMYEKQLSPALSGLAAQARKAVMEANDTSPRMMTAEAGQPGRRRGGYNYLTGGAA